MGLQLYEEKFMRFPQGKSKALTFSYDDGVAADRRLMEIFDEHGLKATFNLNSLLFGDDNKFWHNRMNEEQTYNLFKNCGHEIALHGARHVFLNKVPLPEAANEIIQNRLYLENKFGRIVRGMAYAYGAVNDEVVNLLKILGVKYARTTVSTHSFGLPEDWLKLNPTCHHADGALLSLTEEFLNYCPGKKKKACDPLLFYIWGHSFEFDENDNWEIIENLADRISGRDDIWYATNGEIYDYVKAYESLIFSADGERVLNQSSIPVWLEIRGRTYKIDSGKQVVFDK